MTIATTDGRAALFFDGYLDLVFDDGPVAYPREFWRDARGRFIAIVPLDVTDGAGHSFAHETVGRGIAAALLAACSGYCDLILEYRIRHVISELDT